MNSYCWCPECNKPRLITRSYIDAKDKMCLSLACGHCRVFQLVFSEFDLKGAKYDKESLAEMFTFARECSI